MLKCRPPKARIVKYCRVVGPVGLRLIERLFRPLGFNSDYRVRRTLSGGFNLGFRRGWSGWQRDLGKLNRFARENEFASIDVGPMEPAELRHIEQAKRVVGSMDLADSLAAASADARRQRGF